MTSHSVYIVPGWTEGPGQARKFAACLIKNGFSLSKQIKEADIVVTHSAGCYFVSGATKARLILMIGPSYGLGSIGTGLRQVNDILFGAPKEIIHWGFGSWLVMRFWNAFYLLSQPRRSLEIYKHIRTDPVDLPKADKIIFLDNDDDRDHMRALQKVRSVNKDVIYIALPGLHEDCWINPQPYADLLLREYNK